MGAELLFRQVTFKPPTFFAFAVEDEDRGCPEGIEPTEILRILFNVDVKRNESLIDE